VCAFYQPQQAVQNIMVVGQNHFAEPNQQACFDFSSFNKDFAEPNLQACFDFSSFNKPFCGAKRASML